VQVQAFCLLTKQAGVSFSIVVLFSQASLFSGYACCKTHHHISWGGPKAAGITSSTDEEEESSSDICIQDY
jgi:hypothetical protein